MQAYQPYALALVELDTSKSLAAIVSNLRRSLKKPNQYLCNQEERYSNNWTLTLDNGCW